MNFIKKIVDKEVDDSVHLQFQKFSKGEFRNRAIVEVKKTGKGYNIKTSAEFSNGFVRMMAERLGADTTQVTGAVVSTNDLTGELEFKEKKQFQGVKRYLIDKEMSGNDLIGLLDKFPKTFFALTFKVGNDALKTKPKAPKAAKPGKNGEAPKADFCSLKTADKNIVNSFVFEESNFKEAKINHTFFIEKIIQPEGEKDFAKIRELAKRAGRIVRNAEIDGEEMKQEIQFEA